MWYRSCHGRTRHDCRHEVLRQALGKRKVERRLGGPCSGQREVLLRFAASDWRLRVLLFVRSHARQGCSCRLIGSAPDSASRRFCFDRVGANAIRAIHLVAAKRKPRHIPRRGFLLGDHQRDAAFALKYAIFERDRPAQSSRALAADRSVAQSAVLLR